MTINTINLSTPFLIGTPNSRVSPEWIRLLATLFSNTSTGTSVSSDVEVFSYTQRTPINISYRLGEIEAQQLRRPPIQPPVSDALVEPLRQRTVSSSNNVLVLDDVTTNATVYPLFANGSSGHRIVKSSSSQWTFNPSTGLMTAAQIVAVGAFGCNGKSAQLPFALGGAATDLATVITLANNLRTMAINNGIGKN